MKQLDGESFEFKADFSGRLSDAAKRGIGKIKRPKNIRVVPLDPDADDADNDGLLQEGTNQERPKNPVKVPKPKKPKPVDKPDSDAEPKPVSTTSVDERVANRVSAPAPKAETEKPDEPKNEFPLVMSSEDIDAARYAFQRKWDEENPVPTSSMPSGRLTATDRQAIREHAVTRFTAMEEWESKARTFYAGLQASRAREQAARESEQVALRASRLAEQATKPEATSAVPEVVKDKPDTPKVPASADLISHMKEWDKDNPLPKATDPQFSIEKLPVLTDEEIARRQSGYLGMWLGAHPFPERTTFEAPTGNDPFDDAIGVPTSLTDFEIEKAYEEAIQAWEAAAAKAKEDYALAADSDRQLSIAQNAEREQNAAKALERAVRDHEKKRTAIFESKKNELIEKTLISGDLDEEAFDAAAEAAFLERRKNAEQKAAIIEAAPPEMSTDIESLLADVSPSEFEPYKDPAGDLNDWLSENPEPRLSDFESSDDGYEDYALAHANWNEEKIRVDEEAGNIRYWTDFFDELMSEEFVGADGKTYSGDVTRTYLDESGVSVVMMLRGSDGMPVGSSTRLFRSDGVVQHERLFINDDSQGLGIGSAFNARNEEYYRRMGMEMIEVTGNSGPTMKGATHWPRNGFDWLDEDQKEEFLDILESALEEHRDEIMANKPGPIMGNANVWEADPDDGMSGKYVPLPYEVFRSATEAKELARLVAAARAEQFDNHWIEAGDLLFWSGAEQTFRNEGAEIKYMKPL